MSCIYASVSLSDGTPIWIKLDGGVWWPGFLDNENGAFFDEDDMYVHIERLLHSVPLSTFLDL